MNKASHPKKIILPGYIAVIFMVIGVIFCGWLSQVSLGLHKTIYDNEFYRCALQEVKLEDDLRVLLIEYAIMESDRTVSLALSDIPMIKNALASAISEEWLKDKIDKNLDNAIDFIFGNRDKFVVKAPLAERQKEFEDELSREWKAYPGYAKLGELGIEAPDPTVFIEKIDLPSEITIIDLTDLSEFGEAEQKAISGLRTAKPALQVTSFLLSGLLLAFSLLAFGVIAGLKVFGSGLFLSGLSLYLSWQYMKNNKIIYITEVLETHGLSLLADPAGTANLFKCLQSSFIDLHVIFSGIGLISIAIAFLVQLFMLITKKV